jgi:pyruvate dehydrogenase E2 component (dihydrolipoamide acetyltransferase)
MIELALPSFGADMEDAEFIEWRVRPGQPVKRGDIACVVETQKGAIDVEVWQDATVARLLAEPGQRLPVGHVLALLATEGEDWQTIAAAAPAAPAAHAAPAEPAAPPPPSAESAAAAATTAPARISPAARRRAAELGVDLDALARVATAPIAVADVERAAATRAPESGMRAAIGAAMARSKREIPHYYVGQEIGVERALAWLEATNATRPVDARILFAALALKAVALALHDTPALVGRFVDSRFQAAPNVHVGVVTALRGGGLVVPTVHDADRPPLPELMRKLADVLARARRGALRSSDLADSTVTLTNLGDLGADTVHGVIYPPQVAIVGLGRVSARPWADGSQVVVARTVHATLAGDHRVSDGLVGARFLGLLAERLAAPEAL